ncbi:MAG TPA: tRNA (adenosine(37)-N6)-threonylcarbamoyltransferase complex dimerization subunit type 1 TsaB [Bacteroidales bacterium]|nr:tRNA (adenosine(37)-N6)-threonylcarbamoyltransferase complex dimerization subunit type 1 TsaB [Bacteroidales bacterium]
MALILHIETATNICSVALSDDEKLLALRETSRTNSHSEKITVFVQEVLAESKTEIKDIDAVNVSMGPGSYTGLRIGVSVAKGLCYALDKPLISTGTLTAMAYGAMQQCPDMDNSTLLCPMLDARRMEVYYALFKKNMHEILPPCAKIMDEHSFSDVLKDHRLLLFGDGMDKCKTLFEKNQDIDFLCDFVPSAKHMIIPALQKFHDHIFENIAYFEPFYLKDFIAGKPNVKGLK